MSPTPDHEVLIARAVEGETAALEQLLLAHHDRLASAISRKLPPEFRALIQADDVLQEAFTSAFRLIGRFKPGSSEAFFHWLLAIAENRLLDLVKGLRRAKRGGGRTVAAAVNRAASRSYENLLEALVVDPHTLSRAIARGEALAAMQVALAVVRDDYREALRMRYIDGRPVAEIAAKLNRTERAVQMLCYRGLNELRAALGRASRYFTR
jgi:RNA polymerase sigma-70 factor (ECF subfamily)